MLYFYHYFSSGMIAWRAFFLGCVLVGAAVGSDNKTPLPLPRRAPLAECSSFGNDDRFDCFPEDGATQEKCEARGCCWVPAGKPYHRTLNTLLTNEQIHRSAKCAMQEGWAPGASMVLLWSSGAVRLARGPREWAARSNCKLMLKCHVQKWF